MKPAFWRLFVGVLALLVWLNLPATHAAQARGLSGRWMMAQLISSAARIPVFGELHASTRVVSVHELRDTGERLFGGGRLCTLALDSGSRLVRTRLSAATAARMPRPYVDARLAHGAQGGISFHQKKQIVVVGARLRDPISDPLPRRASDPRVFDEDRDGKPGMTIEVFGILSGQIYVAQRSWTELVGRSVGADAFAGALRFGHEQVVLDATSSRLERSPKTRALPSQSWFRLERLAPEEGCDAARRRSAAWFP